MKARTRRRASARLLLAAGIACLSCLGLTAAAVTPSAGASVRPTASAGEPKVLGDLAYEPDGARAHLLDACLPRNSDAARPAIVLVHGGAFVKGDKATPGIRYICTRLARAGYAAFSVNYRLLPQHAYPDALRDLRAAIRWLRKPQQVRRFHLDPRRIGAFGESAGAVLVAENGTGGTHTLTTGSRVKAVVALSTASSFEFAPDSVPASTAQVAADYLGCERLTGCADRRRASAAAFVNRTDSAFLLAASTDDWIPVKQTTAFAARLRRAHVPVGVVIKRGTQHGLQLLDRSLTDRMLAFYGRHL